MSYPSYCRTFIPITLAAFSISSFKPVSGSAQDAMPGMDHHMKMTTLRPLQPGDRERAEAIVAAARKVMDRYTDYHKALASGYTIFGPSAPQNAYHFSRLPEVREETDHFDVARPVSLLYEKVPDPATRYKLIGVMYTAPANATEEELNRRVPLSIGRWHLHINLCLPALGREGSLDGSDAKFGTHGSIVTAEACQAAGGRFLTHFAGWMVHVYAYAPSPAGIWVSGPEDEHGMRDTIGPGMVM